MGMVMYEYTYDDDKKMGWRGKKRKNAKRQDLK